MILTTQQDPCQKVSAAWSRCKVPVVQPLAAATASASGSGRASAGVATVLSWRLCKRIAKSTHEAPGLRGAAKGASYNETTPRRGFHPRGPRPPYNLATMTTSERVLMNRVAAGDAEAFTELVDRYGARLLTLAWRLLGNRADAEDAVQRALMRCFSSAKSYRPDWAVSTWLYRIATNACVDELRRRASRSALHRAAEDAADGGRGILPSGGNGGDRAPARHLDLRRALERVPRESRILLALRFVDGLSYGELARVRGITINTVKSQLARGKSILRAELTGGRRRPARAEPTRRTPTKGAER